MFQHQPPLQAQGSVIKATNPSSHTSSFGTPTGEAETHHLCPSTSGFRFTHEDRLTQDNRLAHLPRLPEGVRLTGQPGLRGPSRTSAHIAASITGATRPRGRSRPLCECHRVSDHAVCPHLRSTFSKMTEEETEAQKG